MHSGGEQRCHAACYEPDKGKGASIHRMSSSEPFYVASMEQLGRNVPRCRSSARSFIGHIFTLAPPRNGARLDHVVGMVGSLCSRAHPPSSHHGPVAEPVVGPWLAQLGLHGNRALGGSSQAATGCNEVTASEAGAGVCGMAIGILGQSEWESTARNFVPTRPWAPSTS